MVDDIVRYGPARIGDRVWLFGLSTFGAALAVIAVSMVVAGGASVWGALVVGASALWLLYAGLVWTAHEVLVDRQRELVVFRSVLTRRSSPLRTARRVRRGWTDHYYATFTFDGGRARVLQSIDGFDDLVGYLRVTNPTFEETAFWR